MGKLIVESSNKSDSVVDIEEKLQKAVATLESQRENKQFTDKYLLSEKTKADQIVQTVFSNMINEISDVLRW